MSSAKFQLPAPVAEVVDLARRHKQTLVLVTGVFDVLHQEHVNFLRSAQAAGEVLVVGLESDERVKRLKGETRPVNSEQRRLRALISLAIADAVFILPTKFDHPSDHLNLIKLIKPDILAISSHTPNQDVKRKIMKTVGGRVVEVLTQNPAVSTTQILAKKEKKVTKDT